MIRTNVNKYIISTQSFNIFTFDQSFQLNYYIFLQSSVLSEQDWDRERKKQHRLSDVSVDSGVIGPEYLPSPTSTSSSISGTECRDSCIEGSGRSLLCSESSDDGAINSLKSPCSKVIIMLYYKWCGFRTISLSKSVT